MPEAYIYDHVRTPRGRGKKDGSAARSADAPRLAAIECSRRSRERNGLDTRPRSTT